MARLHESRRPLVVSFRRKKPQLQQKQVTIFDKDDVQEMVDGLKGNSPRKELFGDKDDGNGLQPTHICPLNEAFPLLLHSYPRLDQEQHGRTKHNRGRNASYYLIRCNERNEN